MAIIRLLLSFLFVFALGVMPSYAQPDYASGVKKSLKETKKVKFYMTSWCPYCQKMERFLESVNIPYEKFDIDKNQSARKDYKKLGGHGVPLLLIDETVVRGYDPDAVESAWRQWKG